MVTIVRFPIHIDDSRPLATDLWKEVALQARRWLAAEALELRQAVVLLPFAQLLPLARHAFAADGGWMPRIETTQTLAAALGPPASVEAGQVSFDATVDALIASQLLRSRRWGDAWARRDPRGFDRAVGSVVVTAHALLRAAAALPPALRDAHWEAARDLLPPLTGPGGSERLLLRVALEWASLAPAPSSDRLFSLRPVAWIAVQAGGADALTDRLLAEAAGPALLLATDADLSMPFALRPPLAAPPALAVCDGFEDEAQCTAAQVIEHLRRGEAPVALIAQDRLLVRRVRALLEREAVTMRDETGWKLSTTRAAALVMGLLRAARPGAPSDALLDWLKALPDRRAAFAGSLDAFEARLRRRQLARVDAVADAYAKDAADTATPSAAATLWAAASTLLAGLAGAGPRPLPQWLVALREALEACDAWPTMQGDDAGRQVIEALHLQDHAAAAPAWQLASQGIVMGLAGFTDWVDGVLEQANFMPQADAEVPVEVVVTPMPRAILRPFAAIVFPGADDKHLGAAPATTELLSDAQARALGVTDAARRRSVELLSLGQLLRVARITFLRRRLDNAEPLGPSPVLARLSLTLRQQGSNLAPWADPRIARLVEPTPVRPSAPTGADLLPPRLSASACEALRACPYRFFAINMLRLSEEDELDGEIEKRDYGTWLHTVLNAFHLARGAPGAAADETALLMDIADASRQRSGIAPADFLPFTASFATFAPRYIAWLHDRDEAGWRWSQGEVEVITEPAGFGGTLLRGIIDRVDQGGSSAAPRSQLIDYKTGSASSLKQKVREPLEDTQLAFYAALMPTATPLQAVYLALDGRKGIEMVEHPEVDESAEALLIGLADDLRRIRGGAGLQPLGVETDCTYCAARGLCRRDHWSEEVP